MTYIKRQLGTTILELNQQYPVILLTGPRQVGKTTLLKQLIENTGERDYVTLDDPAVREFAANDPAGFLLVHKPPILIDEIQYAPQLFTYIKMHVDSVGKPGQYWLTGSQLYKLMRGVTESLAGRVAILSLFGISHNEEIGAERAPFLPDLERLNRIADGNFATPNSVFRDIWRGSMPAMVAGQVKKANVFYASYIQSYLERDIVHDFGVADTVKFLRFMRSVAARDAQLLNYKAIADEAEINQATVKHWLNVLETLGIIFYLHPYGNNVLKRIVKAPKLYFYDTGLVCYLTKWSSPEVAMMGAMGGALFENYVVAEIVKGYVNNAVEPYLFYYRDRDGKEIDLVIEQDGFVYPAEIKMTANPENRMLRAFGKLDNGKIPRGTGALICLHQGFTAFDREHLVVPVNMI